MRNGAYQDTPSESAAPGQAADEYGWYIFDKHKMKRSFADLKGIPSIIVGVAAYLCISGSFIGAMLACWHWLSNGTWPNWTPVDFGYYPPAGPLLGLNRILAWFYTISLPALGLLSGILLILFIEVVEQAVRAIAVVVCVVAALFVALVAITPFFLLATGDLGVSELITRAANKPLGIFEWLASIAACAAMIYALWRFRPKKLEPK